MTTAAAAMVAAGRRHGGWRCATAGDGCKTTGDNTSHGLAGLGIMREGLVIHALAELKARDFFSFFRRNGLVNVSCHRITLPNFSISSNTVSVSG